MFNENQRIIKTLNVTFSDLIMCKAHLRHLAHVPKRYKFCVCSHTGRVTFVPNFPINLRTSLFLTSRFIFHFEPDNDHYLLHFHVISEEIVICHLFPWKCYWSYDINSSAVSCPRKQLKVLRFGERRDFLQARGAKALLVTENNK